MYVAPINAGREEDETLARCLNNRPGGGHENPDNASCCQRCEFLVQGARVSNYEIISFVGIGSYGHVYKVREPAPLSRILALKVLRLDQFNEKALSSFFDEARRIANLQHPHILPVYNFGQLEDERPYLIMEYAPQTIYDLFRTADGKRRPAFAEELVPYIQQAASALNYVHKNGLIHQDVKPGNLLIGRTGQLLLSDFGTTFYLGMQTHASLGEVTGTAAYMPPEQWQGNPRRDTDQYALAVSCYELLAGRPPFTYKRLEEMWNAHAREQPPALQQWNRRIPAEVAAVLQRGMAKDYHQRYPDILTFSQAYKEAVATAQQRYVCQHCGHQNRTGAQRCSSCGMEYDQRRCLYCEAPVKFGQRCCSICGRLSIPTSVALYNPLAGTNVRQERYEIRLVFKSSGESRVTVALARDTQMNGQRVILKRWECNAIPINRRARELLYYENATAPMLRLRHPLIPRVLDRFVEGKHYYVVFEYIDGETLEERLNKLLRPLTEREVVGYMNNLLNALMAIEQQSTLRQYNISPSHIIIERGRDRAFLTGFRIAPPPPATQKFISSPYLPEKDAPFFDQRTAIYSLAASMHYALTNCPPPHSPAFPPVRTFNPAVSAELERILSKALMENNRERYQSYAELQKDLRKLL